MSAYYVPGVFPCEAQNDQASGLEPHRWSWDLSQGPVSTVPGLLQAGVCGRCRGGRVLPFEEIPCPYTLTGCPGAAELMAGEGD